MEEKMFCFQCQETAKNSGCTLSGVCGKNVPTAKLQDLLIAVVRGLGTVDHLMRQQGVVCNCTCVSDFMVDALFATISCANFDDQAIVRKIDRGLELKTKRIAKCETNGVKLPNWNEVTYHGSSDTYLSDADTLGILRTQDPDVRSLKELATLGLKGMCAYYEHAARLGQTDDSILAFLSKALYHVTDPFATFESLLPIVLETGKWGVDVMALLDKANTTAFGNPEVSHVNIGTRQRPGILVTGHDLCDLEQLLQQSDGQGVDIYTHGEMLSANYYPKLKRYGHLVGNYGNAWWRQREEFSSFNGPIVFTTNCIVPPLPTANYADRVFTTGSVGFPGWKHIEADGNGVKDFSEVIARAKQCQPPVEIECGEIVGGFAHAQVFALADKIVESVKSGAIRHFFVMGGCDGRMKSRAYYEEFAKMLPMDCVILTSGCAKYKYNKLPLGDIGGIPRVLDAGQCNDSYSWAVVALKLKEIFGCNDINELPISFNLAWYEQKAVIVLLALLHLGVKHIHIGPTLPAFLSPNVVKLLHDQFGLGGIASVEEDLATFLLS